MPRDLRKFVRTSIRALLNSVLEDDLELPGTITVIVVTEDGRRRVSRSPGRILMQRDGTVLATVQLRDVIRGFLTRGDNEDARNKS